MRKATGEQDPWRLEERRKERRFTLILRAALIEQEGKTAFCLVKNISPSGVQVKVYRPVSLHQLVVLRVADEEAVRGTVAWVNGDNAGIELDENLDPATLLRVQQKLAPNRRRALPRMDVDAPARLRTNGRIFSARLLDISSLGARVQAEAALPAGERTIVEFADLPSIEALVRWSGDKELGLAFETPIPMQLIAHWIDARRDNRSRFAA